jgi:hypothetical protein
LGKVLSLPYPGKRKVVSYQEHGHALLQGTDQKLFFLRVYLKTNSLQQQQAASFGVCQGKVSQIVRILLEVLDQTLKELKLSPCRNSVLAGMEKSCREP